MKRDGMGRTALARDTDAEPAIDLSPLTEGIGYVLRRAQLASFKNFQQVFGAAGITPAQYSALLIIELNPGLRQTQVSDALGIKRANFVGLVDVLEKRGLARRIPVADRRSYALHITEEGGRYLKSLRMLNATHEAQLLGAMDKGQRAAVLAGLKAIADMETGEGKGGDEEV